MWLNWLFSELIVFRGMSWHNIKGKEFISTFAVISKWPTNQDPDQNSMPSKEERIFMHPFLPLSISFQTVHKVTYFQKFCIVKSIKINKICKIIFLNIWLAITSQVGPEEDVSHKGSSTFYSSKTISKIFSIHISICTFTF